MGEASKRLTVAYRAGVNGELPVVEIWRRYLLYTGISAIVRWSAFLSWCPPVPAAI